MNPRSSRSVYALATAISTACVFAAPQPAQGVAGVLLILLLPGIGLERALAGRAQMGVLRAPVWLAASVASVALLSVALNTVGVTLDRTSWALSALAICVFGGVAWRPGPPRERSRWRATLKPVRVVAGLSVLLLVATAGAVSLISAHDQVTDLRFTQLWAVPDSRPGLALVGVRNFERGGHRFYLTAAVGARALPPREFELGEGKSWTQRVAVRGSGKLRVSLRLDAPDGPLDRKVEVSVR